MALLTAKEAQYGQRKIKDGPTDPIYIAIMERCAKRRGAREQVKKEAARIMEQETAAMAAAQAEWAELKVQAEAVLDRFDVDMENGDLSFTFLNRTQLAAVAHTYFAHDGSFDITVSLYPDVTTRSRKVFKAAALLWTERRVAASIRAMAGTEAGR